MMRASLFVLGLVLIIGRAEPFLNIHKRAPQVWLKRETVTSNIDATGACRKNPCRGRGMCCDRISCGRDPNKSYKCICTAPYQGETCEKSCPLLVCNTRFTAAMMPIWMRPAPTQSPIPQGDSQGGPQTTLPPDGTTTPGMCQCTCGRENMADINVRIKLKESKIMDGKVNGMDISSDQTSKDGTPGGTPAQGYLIGDDLQTCRQAAFAYYECVSHAMMFPEHVCQNCDQATIEPTLKGAKDNVGAVEVSNMMCPAAPGARCKDPEIQACITNCDSIGYQLNKKTFSPNFKAKVDACAECVTAVVKEKKDTAGCPSSEVLTARNFAIEAAFAKAWADGCDVDQIMSATVCPRPPIETDPCMSGMESKIEEYMQCIRLRAKMNVKCQEMLAAYNQGMIEMKEDARHACGVQQWVSQFRNKCSQVPVPYKKKGTRSVRKLLRTLRHI